ncbi:hypothetical protein PtA15_8A30 [Puccinia triticina]|uniref:Carboxypeptidase n=1 Tax=Puccinia triticina TaxID=208348 RepID=A0ABY7CR40_9BASI|nr:uncharacterized protein PtA15_8A30 [Puccinia triticina]WAQ87129.1 hypothetical protein PtA15_8A30 [Puccinia triticina]
MCAHDPKMTFNCRWYFIYRALVGTSRSPNHHCLSPSRVVLIVQLRAATPPGTKPSTPSGSGHLVFKSPLARQYAVPERLPTVPFPIQPSYAGRLDASPTPKQASKIFFWFVPADDARGSNDLTIWINGDDCSGLIGAFNGNGPITMRGKTAVKNPNSWTRSSSMLYLDAPLNAGYSTGPVKQKGSADIGTLVFHFLVSFLKVFPEMKGKNLYLAGQAYSGTYVSYAADKIYAQQSMLALKLQGTLLVNAFISTAELQQHIPAASYVTKNNDVFQFDPKMLKDLQATDNACGLTEYLTQNLKYPPRGALPPVTKAIDPKQAPLFRDKCLIYYDMYHGTFEDFNLWNIHAKRGTSDPNYTKFTYPGQPEFQKAFHVDGARRWHSCSNMDSVFPNGDASPPATSKVLPNVIERSKRTVIAHGSLDGSLPVDGIKLAIQGMTWGGKQGFQTPINSNFLVSGKPSGKFHTERGLTFVEVTQSGSMMPQDQGEAALALLEFLLGHRPTP